MAEITVGQVVKRKAVLVRPDDTIHKVARILARNKVGSAVVVDENEEIVGIITDRDILDKVVAKEGSQEGSRQRCHDHEACHHRG